MQIPFIANDGQANEKVKFYANTTGGSVFVTKDGRIVYLLQERPRARGQKLEVSCQKLEFRMGGLLVKQRSRSAEEQE